MKDFYTIKLTQKEFETILIALLLSRKEDIQQYPLNPNKLEQKLFYEEYVGL